MAEIVYAYQNGIYVNLTNRCPCNCAFCIRSHGKGVGTAENLWLEREPTAKEVLEALNGYPLEQYEEVVFCGYGEPFCALDVLLDVCRELKKKEIKIRVNTNGLGDLIWNSPTSPLLQGLVDEVSVSLNTCDAVKYEKMCHPDFPNAYEAMLKFASDCKKYVPHVRFSVVDVIPAADIEQCHKIADELGIPLRVRTYSP